MSEEIVKEIKCIFSVTLHGIVQDIRMFSIRNIGQPLSITDQMYQGIRL